MLPKLFFFASPHQSAMPSSSRPRAIPCLNESSTSKRDASSPPLCARGKNARLLFCKILRHLLAALGRSDTKHKARWESNRGHKKRGSDLLAVCVARRGCNETLQFDGKRRRVNGTKHSYRARRKSFSLISRRVMRPQLLESS